MNRAQLIGNVGKDPEFGTTTNGSKYARFRIATNEKWTDKATGEKRERTEWHTIIVWSEGLLPVVEKFVKKGTQLFIEGEIRTREWTDDKEVKRWSTEIVLQGFGSMLRLLGSPTGRREDAPMDHADPQAGSRPATPSGNGAHASGQKQFVDDEIPF